MTGNANDELAGAVVAALGQASARHVFLAPGSRSTPLVAALHGAGLSPTLVLDERAAAYAAVGCARVGELAAIVTTSGTAVANLLPGLAEAERDELPVIAVTADRPEHEVRVRANQTIEQPGLLAGVARGRVDLTAAELPDDWREQLGRALAALRGPQPGPVHLNLRFDKPLEPGGDLGDAAAVEVPPAAEWPMPAAPWESAERGLVVVGALPFATRGPVDRLLGALPWPALVDVTSGLDRRVAGRFRPALMRAPEACERFAPDHVLWLGGRVTEPAVGAWLARTDMTQWRTGGANRESDGIRPCSVVVDFGGPLPDPATARPSALDFEALDAVMPEPPEGLNEPAIARLVAETVRSNEVFFVGSSMPIRDVDRFARRIAADVIANRGVSGIDGNLATAIGAHVATRRPTTALLGDLAFLHDAGTLGLLAQSGAAVRVVCVNNDGGGIFHFLPIAAHESIFQPWFTAPHGLDPVAIARGFGVTARRIESFDELARALAVPPSAPEVLEVRTTRDANQALHAELDRRYREALQ
ncbi:MAG: thiamine pyrophosphate-binding protein [bacterium]|nr:thiamine pyrophosphate-binding protein [bacterium]